MTRVVGTHFHQDNKLNTTMIISNRLADLDLNLIYQERIKVCMHDDSFNDSYTQARHLFSLRLLSMAGIGLLTLTYMLLMFLMLKV